MKSKKHFKRQKKRKQTRKKVLLPVFAAAKSLKKTGSISKAAIAYKKQALFDARKLFGSITV
jgi:hypothetical protein